MLLLRALLGLEPDPVASILTASATQLPAWAEGLTLDIQIDEVPPAGSGVFRIAIRIPDGYIDAGFLSICLKPAN